MGLHTWHTTISESPTNFRTTTLSLMAFCKPKTSASHSVVLFVHLNSKRLETKCFLCNGSVKTQMTPKPSSVLDTSKYKVHVLFVQGLLSTLVLQYLLYRFHLHQLGKVGDPPVCLLGWGLAVQDNTPNAFSERNFLTWVLWSQWFIFTIKGSNIVFHVSFQ